MREYFYTGSTPVPIIEFLVSRDPDYDWDKEVRRGAVRAFHYIVGISYQVKQKDRIIHDPDGSYAEPRVSTSCPVLYEDDVLYIINKSAPLPVHPSGAYLHHTLTSILEKSGHKYMLAHRLDSETSGCICFLKKPGYQNLFIQNLKSGSKRYLTVVFGYTPQRFWVSFPIGPADGLVKKRQGKNYASGKHSSTLFYRIAYNKHRSISLLTAFPRTGRKHQIRCHLRESGYPIVGDKIYGKDERYFLEFLESGLSPSLRKSLELSRHFLHAWQMSFRHPASHKRLSITAPLPDELRSYLIRYFPEVMEAHCPYASDPRSTYR